MTYTPSAEEVDSVRVTAADIERFWSRVRKTDTCWLWTGATKPYRGYGRFNIKRRGWPAHRFAYQITNGPVSAELVIDHICRNRACVNPEHLRPLTSAENILAGIGISAINARKTHCKRGHEFTVENTYVTYRGHRECIACKRFLLRRTREKKVACPVCGFVLIRHSLSVHIQRKHGSES